MITRKRSRILFVVILFLAGLVPGLGKAAKKAPILKVIQNKECAYSLRIPKGAKLERSESGECVLKMTLAEVPGAYWISEATITLEVMGLDQEKKAEDGSSEGEPAGSLVAGGLKFTKATAEDSAAGHRYITVIYSAASAKHLYRFTGILAASNPGNFGKSIQNWDPTRSAEKIFDGVVLGFRALE